jgi:hypothetical protein
MPVFTLGSLHVLFAHIPKTGGSTVTHMFRELGWNVDLHDTSNPIFDHSTNFYRRCSPQHLHAKLLDSTLCLSQFDWIFTLVRNPEDRFRSEFAFRNPGLTLESTTSELLEEWWAQEKPKFLFNRFHLDNHLRPQHEFITNQMEVFRLEDGLDAVIEKMERLTNSQSNNDSKVIDLQIRNVSWNSSSPLEISRNVRKDLQRLYKRDFKLFGYEL